MNINIFKNGSRKIFTKKDVDIVVSYMKAKYKAELDAKRFQKKNGMPIVFDDKVLNDTYDLIKNVVNGMDDIDKHTRHRKQELLNSKNTSGAVLSPDDEFKINLDSLKDIKKAGLKKELTLDERRQIRDAVPRFNHIYAAQIHTLDKKNLGHAA